VIHICCFVKGESSHSYKVKLLDENGEKEKVKNPLAFNHSDPHHPFVSVRIYGAHYIHIKSMASKNQPVRHFAKAVFKLELYGESSYVFTTANTTYNSSAYRSLMLTSHHITSHTHILRESCN